jgi:hypothetical protein
MPDLNDGTHICRTCRWAKDNNTPGWKLCAFPLPVLPALPYWAAWPDGVQDGELNGRAKLTLEQIEAIRIDKRTQRTIAKEYSISKSQVGNIKRGEQWK